MATGAGRVPLPVPPPDRDSGRHRARLGRTAAPARPHLPFALRPPEPVPGQRRGRPPPVGHGISAARPFRPRRARGSGRAARAPLGRYGQAAHPRPVSYTHLTLPTIYSV